MPDNPIYGPASDFLPNIEESVLTHVHNRFTR
jgi:hypothetical protein